MGEIDFPLETDGSGASFIYRRENKKTIKVKSISINSILNEFSIENPFLLDLNIKGKEFEIINDKSIQKFQMIRIEYSACIDDKIIGDRDEVIKTIKEYGFNKIRIFKQNESVFDLNLHGTIEASK